ncbi:MAG: hypothetical protein Q7T55_19980, partial [Solirubrobacteraceae bacterium]|nr:hypothetical protein [Solirubrobacteraceae bacterium]
EGRLAGLARTIEQHNAGIAQRGGEIVTDLSIYHGFILTIQWLICNHIFCSGAFPQALDGSARSNVANTSLS